MEKIHILHVMEELLLGGALTAVTKLRIGGLSPDRFKHTLVIIGRNPELSELADVNCESIHCRMDGIWDFFSILRLKKIIKERRADIVHTHMPRADVIGRTAARLASTPVVISTIAALDKHRNLRSKAIHSLLDRITLRFVTGFICVSEAIARHFIEWAPEVRNRVVRIYNGVDLERFNGNIKSRDAKKYYKLSAEIPVIGVTARLCPVKGIEYLLKAVRRLSDQKVNVQCMIVGDGESRADLQELAKKLDIHNKVVFTGYCEDVSQALAAMDLFVISSISEGLPNSILEAMAMRIPVVSTAVGGVGEVVKNGDTGILVPPKDANQLAKAIMTLISDDNMRRAMGNKGRDLVSSHFGYDKMIKVYEQLYTDCLMKFDLVRDIHKYII